MVGDNISTIFLLENSIIMLFLISTRRLPDTKGSYIKLGSIWQAGSVGFNSPSWLSMYQVSGLSQGGKLSLYLEEKYMHL